MVVGYKAVNAADGNARYINIDRVHVVPPEVTWSDIRPRPRRYRGPSDIRTLVTEDLETQYEIVPPETDNARTVLRLRRQPGTSQYSMVQPDTSPQGLTLHLRRK